MYGDKPRRWSDDLTGNDRLRCVVNALTRLRVLSSDGAMNLKHKDSATKRAATCLGSIIRNEPRATAGRVWPLVG